MTTMATTTSDAFARGSGGRLASFAPLAHALLRIGAGLLYMQHGAQKLFGMFGGMGPNGGTVPLISQMGLAGVLEFFGGFLIVLGLVTRPVALLLACEMLVAYFQAHLPQGVVPIENKGELALLFMLVWLFLAGNGAGPFSLDARRR
jgi:putative oxidoreductase